MVRFTARAGVLMLTACSHSGPVSPMLEMFTSFGAVQPEPQPAPAPPAEIVEDPRLGIEGCEDVIGAQARRHGAIHVEAAIFGRPVRLRDGGTEVRLEAVVIYQKDDVAQYREARITCRLDKEGKVVALQ